MQKAGTARRGAFHPICPHARTILRPVVRERWYRTQAAYCRRCRPAARHHGIWYKIYGARYMSAGYIREEEGCGQRLALRRTDVVAVLVCS